MGNSNYKSASVDIPEGSPLMNDVLQKERILNTKKHLSENNNDLTYGSLCCKEREKGNDYNRREKLQMVLKNRPRKKICCKCIYGRCVCESRPRSYSDVSV